MTKVEIGLATLYLGDCLEILPTLPKVDAVITDPPYGINENHKKVASRQNAAKVTDYGDFDWDKQPADPAAIAILRDRSKQQIIWGGNYFDLPPSSCWLIWDKMNTGDFADGEMAWTNLKKAVRFFRHMWNGMIRDSEREQRVHPTQKPVALMRWCLTHLGPISSVLDAYMGSGPVGVACVEQGISYIEIERDPKYFDIACRRIEQAQQQLRLAL